MKRYFFVQVIPGVRVRIFRNARYDDTYYEGELIQYVNHNDGDGKRTYAKVLVDRRCFNGRIEDVVPYIKFFPANGVPIEGTNKVNILIKPCDPYAAWKMLYETSRNVPRQTPDGYQNMRHIDFVDYED